MIRLIICGIFGRMGRTLIDVVNENFSNNCKLVGGLAKNVDKEMSLNVPVFTKISEIDLEWDAIIDVSAPEVLDYLLELDSYERKKLIIGTTGHSDKQLKKIKELQTMGKKIKYVPNASELFDGYLDAVKFLVEKFSKFDIGILDIHHSKKVDAPSGTAKLVSDEISKITSKKPQMGSFRLGEHKAYLEVHMQNGSELIKASFSAGGLKDFARGLIKKAEI